MSEKAPDSEVEKTPEAPQAPTKLRVARVGVKNKGEIVATLAGEPVEGIIADIADGDD
jgi:hypothetical protein